MAQPVGQNVFRVDGKAKVTGEALYIDDLRIPDTLWGMTIRSKVARGKIRSITYDPTFDWTGITCVDHRDIPQEGKNIVALIEDDQPALASDEILHMYEPIVLLACEDPERLEEASHHVQIDVEPLPSVLSIEESRKADVVIRRDDNVLSRLNIDKGDVDAGMAEADVIIEGEYSVSWQEQMYIETNGILAMPREDGGITIYGSLQCPYYIHNALQHLLGIGGEKVQVIQAVTGGGFGGKEDYPSIISCHAALLARKAGKPVKIIYDRGEDVASTTKRHPAVMRYRTGLKNDGTLVAMEILADFDAGAYVTLSPVVLSRGLIHATGAYRVPNVRIRGHMYATNTPPNGAFRGFGNPQVTFAAEQNIEHIAAQMGLDPIAFRRHNMLHEGDTTCTSQILKESVGGEECMDRVLEECKFDQLKAETEAFNAKAESEGSELRRGVGFSLFFHGGGFTGNGEERLKGRVDISLTENGGARIFTGSTDIGQGTLTIFPQIAAGELGLPMELVEMAEPDTDKVPDSGPTVASRTCMVVGRVVQRAAQDLIQSMVKAVGEGQELTYDPSKLAFMKGDEVFCTWKEASEKIRQTPAWPMRVETVYQGDPSIVWDEVAYRGDAYPVFSWGADVAVVEVNMDTFEIKMLALHTAEDVGKAINPLLVEGQIEGGTLQGIGYAVMEELKMKDGAVLNHRMTNYIIPTSLDAPEIHTYIVEVPYSNGPYGAKGVGELPMDGPAPAVAAAISMATGAHVCEIPFTPEKLQRALSAQSA